MGGKGLGFNSIEYITKKKTFFYVFYVFLWFFFMVFFYSIFCYLMDYE